MKKVLVLLFAIVSGMVAKVEVFDLSAQEYAHYQKAPNEAIESFKKKFLLKQNASQPVLPNEEPIDKETGKLYSKEQLIDKLKYNILVDSKEIEKILLSCEEILGPKKAEYDINDIKIVLKQIHSKEISSFEANMYLNQIIVLLRG